MKRGSLFIRSALAPLRRCFLICVVRSLRRIRERAVSDCFDLVGTRTRARGAMLNWPRATRKQQREKQRGGMRNALHVCTRTTLYSDLCNERLTHAFYGNDSLCLCLDSGT